MPTSNKDIDKITSLRRAQSESNSQAADYNATALTLNDLVMNAVTDDRAKRGVSQLATDVGNVGGQLVSDPNRIREFGGDTVNPMDIDSFTSQARARNMRTLGTIATQEDENTRSLEDIIGAGSNRLQSMAMMKESEAQKAKEEAEALYDQLYYEQSEKERKFEEQQAMGRLKTSGSGTTRESDFGDFADDIAGYLEQIEAGKTTEEQARFFLKGTYPWLTDEELDRAFNSSQSDLTREDVDKTYGKITGGLLNLFKTADKTRVKPPASSFRDRLENFSMLDSAKTLLPFAVGSSGREYTREEIEKMTPEERKLLGL